MAAADDAAPAHHGGGARRVEPADWRPLDPDNTLYLQLAAGRVVIELAPDFAPQHAANIRTLVREGYFDGLAIIRSQDNFVVQWGDPDGKRALGGRATLPPEFTVRVDCPAALHAAAGRGRLCAGGRLLRRLSRRRATRRPGEAWLAHCYAMVGAGRDNEVDSGNGAELYVVIGHAPRQLDRNIALVGRVVQGMELLSVLPRGAGPLGFYEQPEQHVPIRRVRVAADVPEAERARLEVMRTDTPTFAALVEAGAIGGTTGTRCRPVTSTSATCRSRSARPECCAQQRSGACASFSADCGSCAVLLTTADCRRAGKRATLRYSEGGRRWNDSG